MIKIRCGGLCPFTSSVLELSCIDLCSTEQHRPFSKVLAITRKNTEQILPLISSNALQLSSLILSRVSVLLSLQPINLKLNCLCRKMDSSVGPRSSSKSFICLLIRRRRLFLRFFLGFVKWSRAAGNCCGGWREIGLTRMGKKLLQVCVFVCVWVTECLFAPPCYIPLYSQAPSVTTWVNKQPQICGMKKELNGPVFHSWYFDMSNRDLPSHTINVCSEPWKRDMSLIDLNFLFVDNYEKSYLLKHYKGICITTVTTTPKTVTNTVINGSLFRLSFPLKWY